MTYRYIDSSKTIEQFEEWYINRTFDPKDHGPLKEVLFAKNNKGAYNVKTVREFYTVWRASRKAIDIELPWYDSYDNWRAYEAVEEVQKILEGLGFTVKGPLNDN